MANKNEFSAKQKEEILKQAITFWDKSTQQMSSFFENVNQYERLARVLLPSELEDVYSEYTDRSALVPPDIYNNINSLQAHIRTALFRKKPYHRVTIAGQPNVQDARVKKAGQLLQTINDLEAEGRGFPSEADKIIYQTLYAGLSCSFLQYTRNWRKVAQRDPKSQQLLTDPATGRPVYEFELVSEYPESVAQDIRRCRIDPSAVEIKDIRIIGVHGTSQYSQLVELNRMAESYYSFDEKELWGSSFNKEKYFEFAKDETETYTDKGTENSDFGDKIIEVWSIRGLFRFKDGDKPPTYKDLVVEVGNRKVLLAVKENDLPLAGWELFDFPAIDRQYGRIFTMGVVEPARDTFIERFIKINQSIDAANRDIYVNYIGDSSACQNLPDIIETSNDRILKIDLMASGLGDVGQALRVLDRPQTSQDTFTQSLYLSRAVQQTMRMSDYLQGSTPTQSETATGVSELVSGGKSLTEHLMSKLADTYLIPVAIKKLILWNFFNADKAHTIYAQNGAKYDIEPGELNLPFNVTIETNLGATNPAMVRRLVEAYPVIANDPYYDPMEVRKVFVEMLELPNSDSLVPDQGYDDMIVERENAALGYGIELPIHPMDKHQKHIDLHSQYRDWIMTNEQPELTTEELDLHIEQHLMMIEEQNLALGNTKEMGGNTGNLVQPDSASMNKSATGRTGQYTPSEKR